MDAERFFVRWKFALFVAGVGGLVKMIRLDSPMKSGMLASQSRSLSVAPAIGSILDTLKSGCEKYSEVVCKES
jgi:hypothetical protein